MTFHGNIIFPEGAGGNHLRWLLFLDPKYTDPFNNYLTPEDKLLFIQQQVYPKERTWNTWLQYEWRHRHMLDGGINLSHNYQDWQSLTNHPTLFITFADYQLPITHYFHINLGMNSTTPDQIKTKFLLRDNAMQDIKQRQTPLFNFVNGDTVFDSVLDRNFYQQLTATFGFSNLYDYAAKAHAAYSQCRKRSAQDFCDYFNSTEFRYYQQRLMQISR